MVPEPLVIVFSDVLSSLAPVDLPLSGHNARRVAALGERGVALVICSPDSPADVKRIQTQLGLAQPSVCDGGDTVVLPESRRVSDRREERVIRCEPLATSPCRYARGISMIREMFDRGGAPVLTVGLTDPTKPDNLASVVDRTIFVGSDDASQGGVHVADWVAAIVDVSDQLRQRAARLPGPPARHLERSRRYLRAG
jgi:hypothetical protein